MSYWTYTDLFEEPGPPTAPFQGGFGLLNPQGIRKSAYFAYKYLHALEGSSLATSDPQAMLSAKDGNIAAVIWDFETPDQKVSNRPFFTKITPSHPTVPVTMKAKHLLPGVTYQVTMRRTGFHSNDAYSAYLEMGAPKDLTVAQVGRLNYLTRDLPEMQKMLKAGKDGSLQMTVPMNSNDIVLITIQRDGEQRPVCSLN